MSERTDDTGFPGIMITQDTDSFCYGIDAVLAADFAARGRHRSYMDLGTNNGIIPLLLSSLTAAEHIAGIEVQEAAAGLARRNVKDCGLEHLIEIECCDVLDAKEKFAKGSFEAVVTNPPYFRKGGGIINRENSMQICRHETTASLRDFVQCAAWLLEDRGAFYMIHRPDRLADIIWCCREARLEPKCMRFVSPRRDRAPNLLLIECRKNGGAELRMMEPLAVYNEEGGYTEEILKIYRRK